MPPSFCPVPHSPCNLAFSWVGRWNTYVVDGRDVEALCQVFWQASQVKNKPTAVVAKTFKGRGIPSKQMFLFCSGLLKTPVCIAVRQKEAHDGKAGRLA